MVNWFKLLGRSQITHNPINTAATTSRIPGFRGDGLNWLTFCAPTKPAQFWKKEKPSLPTRLTHSELFYPLLPACFKHKSFPLLSCRLPFVSLAGLVVAVGLVFRVFLVDAVVGQVHELVTQSLHGRRIPTEEKHM